METIKIGDEINARNEGKKLTVTEVGIEHDSEGAAYVTGYAESNEGVEYLFTTSDGVEFKTNIMR